MIPAPTSLENDGDALVIHWSDGVNHRIPWRVLRHRCPCATCRAESEKPPKPIPLFNVLSPSEARPLRPAGIKPVGNYAYGISFNDGHNTGIYSLDFLRELGTQAAQDSPAKK